MTTSTTTTKTPTAKAKARATAAAVMVDAIDGVDKAHGAVTLAALVNEALYRPIIGGADGVVPRTGDLAPKGYYVAAGLSEAMYDRAKGYLSDARNVIGHAVAMGAFDHKAVTNLAKAEAMGPAALQAVAKAVGVDPDDRGNVSLTKVSAAVRAKAKGQGAPRAKADAVTKAKAKAEAKGTEAEAEGKGTEAKATKAEGIDVDSMSAYDVMALATAIGARAAGSDDLMLSDVLYCVIDGAGIKAKRAAAGHLNSVMNDYGLTD